MLVIIVKLELVLGSNKHSFGLEDPSSDLVAELVDRLVSGLCAIWLKAHPREAADVHHEWNLLC
jgi:hypothetical protein